jgi:hypothetical protein
MLERGEGGRPRSFVDWRWAVVGRIAIVVCPNLALGKQFFS